MTAPCRWAFGHDCPLRTSECHTGCPQYAEFVEEREKHRNKRGAETASMPELPRKVVKQIWKEMKGR